MSNAVTPIAEAGVALTLQWLRAQRGGNAELVELRDAEGVALAELSLEQRKATLAIVPVFETDDETTAAAAAIAAQLANEDGLILWVPPGATLPTPDNTDFLQQVGAAAATLTAGERGEVRFPVTLGIRKADDAGSYLSVQGGLSPHWARFTTQVMGQYQLDSTAIHRLPEDAAAITQLIDYLVLVANGIHTPGKTVQAKAEDAWSLQRVSGLQGARVIAAPPGAAPEQGTPVRKALRSGVRTALAALDAADTSVRLLTFVGVFRSMAEEKATIALRGLDPSTFARFDAACLAADAQLSLLFGPSPESGLGTDRA